MKKLGAVLLLLCLLTGCSSGGKEMNRAVDLRSRLLSGEGCSFDTEVTADYGDSIHRFSLHCTADSLGNLTFEITKPQTIAGIRGEVSEAGGRLTFDQQALQFDLLTDQQLSPVSAPWIFLKTLRGGYLTSAGMEGELLRVSARDSYREDALFLDLWLDENNSPQRAEILWKGRRILTLAITGFQIDAPKTQAFSLQPYNFTTCVG